MTNKELQEELKKYPDEYEVAYLDTYNGFSHEITLVELKNLYIKDDTSKIKKHFILLF